MFDAPLSAMVCTGAGLDFALNLPRGATMTTGNGKEHAASQLAKEEQGRIEC